MIKVLVILGTRPEAIKLSPIIKLLREDPFFDLTVCSTGQHKEMLQQILDFFGITVDINMNIMKPNQNLFDITANSLKKLEQIYSKYTPHITLVQGDTTTAFTAALSSFYYKIPIGHIEAGLRTYNNFAPFPEEVNRSLISRIADIHFTPTQRAKENLLKENIPENNIFTTGNTVIDSILWAKDIINNSDKRKNSLFDKYPFISEYKTILITGHRRESFGKPFINICTAIKHLASDNPQIQFIYPVHLNPNVRKYVFEILSNLPNIHLIDPVPYDEMIFLMQHSYLILTDSGGIQEEAPALNKPVIVMRATTERTEGIETGVAVLAGTTENRIYETVINLLNDKQLYSQMASAPNPYGDGTASQKIIDIIKGKFQ